jgi:hypothetical protein
MNSTPRYMTPFKEAAMAEATKPSPPETEPDHLALWDAHGKLEINALVWKWLPDTCSLRQADEVAGQIHDLIEKHMVR